MIYLRQKNLGFVHIAKTGGSSITYALAPYLRKGPHRLEGKGWQIPYHATGHMHEPLSRSLAKLGTKPDRFFTVVRNPFSRVVSCFLNRPADLRSLGTLLEFLDARKRDAMARRDHLSRPACWYLDRDVDLTVLRFENLENDFREFMTTLGPPFDSLSLPHVLNRNHPPYQQVLADDAVSVLLIKEIYAQDFERFGYDPTELD